MGLTARLMRVLGFTRVTRRGAPVSDIDSAAGGGYNATPEHMQPTGDDARPLRDDYLVVVPMPGGKRSVAVGFLDPLNEGVTGPGEKRIYARNEEGAPMCQVWLKATGEVLISNDNGSVTLRPDGGTITESPGATFDVAADGSITGDNGAGFFSLLTSGVFDVNGLTIDTEGRMTTPTQVVSPSVLADGVEVAGHNHSQNNDSDGSAEEDTNPMQEP